MPLESKSLATSRRGVPLDRVRATALFVCTGQGHQNAKAYRIREQIMFNPAEPAVSVIPIDNGMKVGFVRGVIRWIET